MSTFEKEVVLGYAIPLCAVRLKEVHVGVQVTWQTAPVVCRQPLWISVPCPVVLVLVHPKTISSEEIGVEHTCGAAVPDKVHDNIKLSSTWPYSMYYNHIQTLALCVVMHGNMKLKFSSFSRLLRCLRLLWCLICGCHQWLNNFRCGDSEAQIATNVWTVFIFSSYAINCSHFLWMDVDSRTVFHHYTTATLGNAWMKLYCSFANFRYIGLNWLNSMVHACTQSPTIGFFYLLPILIGQFKSSSYIPMVDSVHDRAALRGMV